MTDHPQDNRAVAAAAAVISSSSTDISVASPTTTTINDINPNDHKIQQPIDHEEKSGRHRNRRSNSDIPKAIFDQMYYSEPTISATSSMLIGDDENNKNGTSSSSAPVPIMKESNIDLKQEQEETRPKQQQQRRNRRSNSDIPMAILEHGSYQSAMYPPIPSYYGSMPANGPAPYLPPWGYGFPPPGPPPNQNQLYHLHQAQSLRNIYHDPNVVSSGPGSMAASGYDQQQQQPHQQQQLQQQQHQNSPPPPPMMVLPYPETFHNNPYYPGAPQSQQQQHLPPPAHMMMMPPNKSAPLQPPLYHQQFHQQTLDNNLDRQLQQQQQQQQQQQSMMMLQRLDSQRRTSNLNRPSHPNMQKHDGRHRKTRSHHHASHHQHRKSLSSSMNAAEYGSFWNGLQQQDQEAAELNNIPIVVRSVGRGNQMATTTGTFSPGNDLRKMFQGLSPKQSSRKMIIDGDNNNYANTINGGNHIGGGNYIPWSSAVNAASSNNMMPPSPRTFPSTGIMSSNNSSSSSPVNALYKGVQVPTRESTRKRQIRQQSAQMSMESIKGIEQPSRCRNVFFLLLFVFHLLLVGVYLGEEFAKEAFVNHFNDPDTVTIHYHNLLFITILSGSFAILSSTMLLCAMTIFARRFLQIALFVIITLAFVWGTLGVGLSPKTIVPVTGIIALGLAVAYAFIVWDRISFSASNMLCALSGIRTYPTTIILAIFMQIFTMGWCIYASIIASGVYNAISVGKVHMPHNAEIMIYCLLLFSFYWTSQVLHGCVEAATAGVISGWWHSPGYSNQVRDSVFKTLFYSMGSICFGGLVIGPVWIIHQFSILIQPSQLEPSLLCFHRCLHFIQVCLSSAVDYMTIRCNEYSFTYIGMYHYGFLDAGKNAYDLFEKRGWTTIVSDDLIPNVLFLTSIVMGGLTGCFAHLMAQIYNLSLTSLPDAGIGSFLLGTILGLVVNSILFSVVSSSVNTVLVCFASSPLDFDRNHPELSIEMRASWREVWPGALDINNNSNNTLYQHPLPVIMSEREDEHYNEMSSLL